MTVRLLLVCGFIERLSEDLSDTNLQRRHLLAVMVSCR